MVLKQIKVYSIGSVDSFGDKDAVNEAFVAMSQQVFEYLMHQIRGPRYSVEDIKKLELQMETKFYRHPTLKYNGSVIGTLSHEIESTNETRKVTIIFNPITSN